MSVATKVLKQKRGVNFQTLVVLIVLSGAYVQVTGESINLQASQIPNTSPANVVTGPSVAPVIPPRLYFSVGGYIVTLTPTATALLYTLQVWTSGGTELAAGNYPATVSGGTITVEIDFGTGGFDS